MCWPNWMWIFLKFGILDLSCVSVCFKWFTKKNQPFWHKENGWTSESSRWTTGVRNLVEICGGGRKLRRMRRWSFDFGGWILEFWFWILEFWFWILEFWFCGFGFWSFDFRFWIQKKLGWKETEAATWKKNLLPIRSGKMRKLWRDPSVWWNSAVVAKPLQFGQCPSHHREGQEERTWRLQAEREKIFDLYFLKCHLSRIQWEIK